MRYLEYNSLKDFVKDILIEELENYKDTTSYGCDLSYTLLEGYNIDGVYFYNNYKAIDFIKKHFEDFGEVVEEITFQLGSENIPNIFDEPDSFCVVCFIEIASYLLSQCKYVDDNWNNKITLNDRTIKIINQELEEV